VVKIDGEATIGENHLHTGSLIDFKFAIVYGRSQFCVKSAGIPFVLGVSSTGMRSE
jgi:hypothetical protein